MRGDRTKLRVDLRPEAELLLCCARTSIDLERVERIKALLKKELDWLYLIRMMLAHGMLPLLYKGLKQAGPEAISSSTMDQLKRQYEASRKRNASMAEELVSILTLFERHDIIAIPFKGAALAAYAYGDLSLRQYADLDILVKKSDVFKAMDLLASRSYRPHFHLTAAEQETYLQTGCEFVFINPDGKIGIELHWRITPRYFYFPLRMNRLWDDLDEVALAGKTVRALPAEELLLILCVHGSKHQWERLNWICDVAELIRTHPELDWEKVVGQADSLGVRRMLSVGLLLASHLLGATLPEKVSQRIESDPVIEKLAASVGKRLFRDPDGPRETSDIPIGKEDLAISLIHFHLRLRERLLDRMRYCLHIGSLTITPTKKDRAFLQLPAFLSFLYYLLRPFRLAGEYGFSPFMKTLIHILGK